MKSLHLICGVAGAALLLSSCNDNNSTPPLTGAFRVVNGVTDSTGMDASLNDVPVFSGIGFGSASGINNSPEGSFPAKLTHNSHSGNVDDVNITHNNLATVFAYGTVAGGTDFGFKAYQSLVAPAAGTFMVQPVHDAYASSPTHGTLSFYFVAPGAGIGGATAMVAAFGASPDSHPLNNGTYEIIVTDGVTTMYDSGPVGVALPPGGTNVLQVAALDAPGAPDGSPISLLVLDNAGGNTVLLNGAH
jgi:hypothetical protein